LIVTGGDAGGHGRDIKLKGPLYISGIETKLRGSSSLTSSGLQLQSFRGCMKNIRIDYRLVMYHFLMANSTDFFSRKIIFIPHLNYNNSLQEKRGSAAKIGQYNQLSA